MRRPLQRPVPPTFRLRSYLGAASGSVEGVIPTGGWAISLLDVGAIPMESEQLAPEGVFTGTVDTPVNALLLRGHGRTVLVDAGSGILAGLWPGTTDDLAGRLAEAGCRPDAIDLIVLTHLDFDHVGGVIELAPRPAPGLSPRPRGGAGRGRSGRAVRRDRRPQSSPPARRVPRRLGLLDELEDGAEPAPGLRLRSAPGHRAGHSVLEIGGADPLVHLADIVHHPLHCEHLEWDATDSDPALALETRRALLAELAERRARVVGSHLPGVGLVERAGDSFRWTPV